MKALITGKSKLAGAIMAELHDTIVVKKLEIESCRAEADIPWRHFDIFINIPDVYESLKISTTCKFILLLTN